MVRSCVSWCRHLLYALIVLALIGCLTEIGLRVYDSATGQVTRRDLYDRGMICKSWSVHHHLKPSRTFSVRNPDQEQRIAVSLNSLGLRGKEPAIPKSAGVFRIVCLGDEITLAPQTAEAETYCSQLRHDFPESQGRHVEVLNAGIPDYCPLLSYLQMKHQLLGLQPDLVIVNFEMGDVADDYRYRRLTQMAAGGLPVSCTHPGLEMNRRGAKSKESSKHDLLLLPQWCKYRLGCVWAAQSMGEKPTTIDAPQSRYLWLEDQPPEWSVYIDQSLMPVVAMRDLVAGLGAQLLVVACPSPWQVSADASNGEGVREQAGVSRDAHFRSRRPFEIIAEFCRAHHLAYCDVSPAFQRAERPERLFLKHAAALSPEGHALYARQLAEFLARRSVGSSPAMPARQELSDEFPSLPQARLPAR